MGLLFSHHVQFYIDFGIYHGYIDSISRTKSLDDVLAPFYENSFTTLNQMRAVSVLIHEKVVKSPEVSEIGAMFVKKLENKRLDHRTLITFKHMFLGYMNYIMEKYFENEIGQNSETISRHAERTAVFIGYLGSCDFYSKTDINKIANLARIHGCSSLIDIMMASFTREKILVKPVKSTAAAGAINTSGATGKTTTKEPEVDEPYNRELRQFLDKIRNIENYDKKLDMEIFKDVPSELVKAYIVGIFNNMYEKRAFLNVYRNNLAKIRCVRLETVELILHEMFELYLQEFKECKDKKKLTHMCNVIFEFFTAGLVHAETMERFFDAAKISKLPDSQFCLTYTDVLTKSSRPKMAELYKFFTVNSDKVSEYNNVVLTAKDYVQNFNKRVNGCLVPSDHTDFRDYLSKNYQVRKASSESKLESFKCLAQPSCHISGLKGFDMLLTSIGHSFFTQERLESCVQLTTSLIQNNSVVRIGERMEREMMTFLPYFKNNWNSSKKLESFTNLVVLLNKTNFLDDKILLKWCDMFHESITSKVHVLGSDFARIYIKLLDQCTQLKIAIHSGWSKHAQIFKSRYSYISSKFHNFEEFQKLIAKTHMGPNFYAHTELHKIKIPREESFWQQMAELIVDYYVNKNLMTSYVTSLLAALAQKPQIDMIVLQSHLVRELHSNLQIFCADVQNNYGYMIKIISLIDEMCCSSQTTRHELAETFRIVSSGCSSDLEMTIEFLHTMTIDMSKYFVGSRSLLSETEKVLNDFKKTLDVFVKAIPDSGKVKRIIHEFDEIITDSNRKKMAEKTGMKITTTENIFVELRDQRDYCYGSSSSTMPTTSSNLALNPTKNKSSYSHPSSNEPHISQKPSCELAQKVSKPAQQGSSLAQSSSISATNQACSMKSTKNTKNPSNIIDNQEKTKSVTPKIHSETQPGISDLSKPPPPTSIDNIKDFNDFCSYFDSLDPFTAIHDEQLFNPKVISSIKNIKKHQVTDFCDKFLVRLVARQNPVTFFANAAQRLANDAHNLKNNLTSFRKILINEVIETFSVAAATDKSVIVEFMCELYNKDFLTKSQMIGFVEKFKDVNLAQHLKLLWIYIRNCSLKLTGQGDKQQLSQIRSIAKNARNLDKNSQFLVQNIVASINSILSLSENIQKSKISNEKPQNLIKTLLEKSTKHPQVAALSADKLDDVHRAALISECLRVVRNPVGMTGSHVEFFSELYNRKILGNAFMNEFLDLLVTRSHTDAAIPCKFMEIVFENCSDALEMFNKGKLDGVFEQFNAEIVTGCDPGRAEYLKKFLKWRAQNWQLLDVPKSFYDNFLLEISINSSSTAVPDQVLQYLKFDEEEMNKFIQSLWMILLTEETHPSRVNLCLQLACHCPEFLVKLTDFLSARCRTFCQLDDTYYTKDVRDRLGKILIFIAQLYSHENSVPESILEQWLETKLIEKILLNSITKLFDVLNGSERFVGSDNQKLKMGVEIIEKICLREIQAQVESITLN